MHNKSRMPLALLIALTLVAYGEYGYCADTPESLLGERLFDEPRFAQAFFAQCNGNVNATVPGDPVLDQTVTAGSPLPGAFAGKTMNCAACHLEDQQKSAPGGGMRTYCDFARRSPVPARNDGNTLSVRNSPILVGASLPRQQFFLHLDGEFASPEGLAEGAFTGRNLGWLASERAAAVKHFANVIRGDNGQGALAQANGGAYAKVFAGDSSVPAQFLIAAQYRLDVAHSSDEKVLAAAAELVGVFLRGLDFSQDAAGNYNGSPYDLFLAKNNLPPKPNSGETDLDYSRRLRTAVSALTTPVFVTPNDGSFTIHAIPFAFGADELAGLKVFLTETVASSAPAPTGGVGNCIACHAAPHFTDFRFHNIGVSQLEYDSIHGSGAFAALKIPTLSERMKKSADVLPPSARHPINKGSFRAIPDASDASLVDLGMWNVYDNRDIPNPQKSLKVLMQIEFGKLNDAMILDKTIATFKTPGLRDLADSQPYLHNGSLDNVQDVMQFYLQVSDMARQGLIRNADPQLANIVLTPQDAAQIATFLNALTEDFSD